MTQPQEPRRRSRTARSQRGGDLVRQPPFRQPRRLYRPTDVLPEERIEAIHQASLRVLEEIGLRVLSGEARAILRSAGARVDEGEQMVRLDRGLLAELLAQAPAAFTVEARDPAKRLRIGEGHIVFASVGGPAFVSDLAGGRRAGTHAEVCDFLRLVQALNILHQEGGGPFEALDLPQESRHLDLYRAQIGLLDKNWQPWGLGRVRARDALEMVAIAAGTTREALTGCWFTCVINTNSPLQLDIPMAEGLIEMASHGQCVVVTPFTLAGAMSPVTLAGALAQQNAEALFGIALAQAVRPGAPVMYGGFTTNTNMRSGAPAFGTPEYVLAAQITGQLARRYGLPFRSSSVTAANAPDAQAAWESEMALWGAVMGGASLVLHAAGWLSGGLVASFEKLILDAEMLQMLAAYLQPPEVNEATLALDAIREVGPAGHFFGTAHTLARYETAFYDPLVAEVDNYDNWVDRGCRTADQRAAEVCRRLLAQAETPPLDRAVGEALDAYVARRKQEIARGMARPE